MSMLQVLNIAAHKDLGPGHHVRERAQSLKRLKPFATGVVGVESGRVRMRAVWKVGGCYGAAGFSWSSGLMQFMTPFADFGYHSSFLDHRRTFLMTKPQRILKCTDV
jgi:hypothetical protein